MLKKYNIFVISGIIFTIIVGTLLHFIYEWSGNNAFVGIIAPVNESVWEHMKLLFFPYTVWIIIGYFIYGKRNKNYVISSFIGLIIGLLFIPIAFFIYTSFTGTSYVYVDITIYIISVLLSFLISGYLFKNYNLKPHSNRTIIILWEVIFLLFAIFTVFHPDLLLFKDFSK